MRKTLTFLLPVIALTCVACDQRRDTPTNRTNTGSNIDRPQDRTTIERREENRRVSMSTYGSKTTEHTQTEADRALIQKIRQALLNDSALSTSVKNIQISTNDGSVTLRGIVLSDREKTLIANKVRMINGVTNIENQLDVSANGANRTTRDSQY